MTLGDKVIPHYIGVDVGCGVTAHPIGNKINYPELDKFIRRNVPHGMNCFKKPELAIAKRAALRTGVEWDDYAQNLAAVSKKVGCQRSFESIGTLGGGNHFIEVDEDESDRLWLIIHSGSRNFGLQVANYHQNIAVGKKLMSKGAYKAKINELKSGFSGKELEAEIGRMTAANTTGKGYLEGESARAYFADMKIAQAYAGINRRAMMMAIMEYLKENYREDSIIESVHNYVDFNEEVPVLRKGAIRGRAGELAIIPLNMRDGTLFVEGKSNPEWNWSLPHGAGRVYSRTRAKEALSMEDFKEAMKDVYTSCVSTATIDESPMAYKPVNDILASIEPNAIIKTRLVPRYNFKAAE
jgi:RNA-splicing ligase RtcB